MTIGNVGQLAADLLISTAQLPLVGYLESAHVLPCFGLDAFISSGGPTTALELFLDARRRVLVLQQRSPVVTGCQRRFVEELFAWIAQTGLAKVGGLICTPTSGGVYALVVIGNEFYAPLLRQLLCSFCARRKLRFNHKRNPRPTPTTTLQTVPLAACYPP